MHDLIFAVLILPLTVGIVFSESAQTAVFITKFNTIQ